MHSRDGRGSDPPPVFRVGPWLVDSAADEIRGSSTVVRVRPKVMALLVVLAERPSEVRLKRELLDRVWPDVVVTEASLAVAVAELREALGDDSSSPSFVETIPRRGYRLIAPVEGHTTQPRPPSRYSLIGVGLTIPLSEGRTAIGRDSECDVRLDSYHVSRVHAALEIAGDRVVIEDLGSKNGTFVGECRIEATTRLQPGDRIRFGRHGAVLQLVGGASSTLTEESAADHELLGEP